MHVSLSSVCLLLWQKDADSKSGDFLVTGVTQVQCILVLSLRGKKAKRSGLEV